MTVRFGALLTAGLPLASVAGTEPVSIAVDAYTVWQGMGSSPHPSPDQLDQLKQKEGLELLEPPRLLSSSEGKITIETERLRGLASLLELDWN